MKGSTIIAVAAGLTASLVSAQLPNIPQCALSCALAGLTGTGCATTDIQCICSASSFLASLVPCVQGACTPAEYEATIQAATALCLSAGVTLSVPTGPTSTAASSAASSASSVEESSTSAPSEESSTPVYSTMETTTTPPPTAGNATTTTGGVASPTTRATTPTVPPPASTSNPAGRNTVAIGGLGAILALVAALL